MKKYIEKLLILFLCVIFLTSCSRKEDIEQEYGYAVSTITDAVEPETAPQEFSKIPIPSGKTVYNADLYDADNIIFIFGKQIYREYEIALYNITSGEFETLYSGNLTVQSSDFGLFHFTTLSLKPYVVAESVHEVVYRFDDDFTDVAEISTYDIGTYSFEYLVERDSLIYSINSNSASELRERSFTTGKDDLLVDFSKSYTYANLNCFYDEAGIAIFDAGELFTDKNVSFLLDMNDLSIIGQCDSDYSLYSGDGGKLGLSFFTNSANNLSVTYVDMEQETVDPVYILDLTDCIYSINASEYMFVFEAEGGSECDIKAYNLNSGVLAYAGGFDYSDFASLQIPIDAQGVNTLNVYLGGSEKYSYNSGKLLFNIILDDGQIDSVILWNTQLAKIKHEYLEKSDTIDYPIYEVHEHTYDDSNTGFAEHIENTFGVNIYYGADADVEFNDYTVEMVYDENAIYKGLKALEKTLSLFPDGFFAEFSNSGYLRGINFYLCGSMSPYNDGSISNAAAFTYTDSGYAMVVADVWQEHALVSHFCHELSHVIENRLIAEEILDEDVWNSLNPDGFEYNYSYLGEDGNSYESSASDEYTTFDEKYFVNGDIECIYFIDSYAKTYPTEDRARIFEYAIVPSAFTSEHFESSHMQSKLEYLSKCIRECWDSSDWSDGIIWEQFL